MDSENEDDDIDERTLKKQSVTTGSSDWLLRAIQQTNAHLTVGVAYSRLLWYDELDRLLIKSINNN